MPDLTIEQMVESSGLTIINGTRKPGEPGRGIYDAPPEVQAEMIRQFEINFICQRIDCHA